MGHPDYFALQVAAYGMTADEMVKLQDEFLKQLRPLYLQLHTWTKYELAKKYRQPVPKLIPAHWINNRWSQEWTGVVEAANIDDRFKDRTAGMDRQDSRAVLHRARFQTAAGELLDQVGSVSGPAGRSAQEKHARLLLACRSARTTFARSERRTEFAMVFHRPPRARPRLLLHGYTRPEVPPLLRTRREPGFSRGHGRIDFARGEPGSLSASARRSSGGFQGRRHRVSARMTRWRVVPVHFLGLRHNDALGS